MTIEGYKPGKPCASGEVKVGDTAKVAPDLKAPLVSLEQSKFDALYAELKFNTLPEKVLGEWDF